MRRRVFIDGEAGTTGLRIREHLAERRDLEIVRLAPEKRRDRDARTAVLNEVDLAILCLPDEAAREAVSWISNPDVKVLDASSAHRTAPGWIYGFPELVSDQRDRIRGAQRVSNPGCIATGFIASVRPLIERGIIPKDWPLSVHSLSGYSGAGREVIRVYEEELRAGAGFALYALELSHKHLPEMEVYGGLARAPLFVPGIGHFRCGLITSVPLHLWALPSPATARDLHEALVEHYRGELYVRVMPLNERSELRAERYLDVENLNGTNQLELFVFANESRGEAVIVARFDNLGKGASGAAVQNMNLMLNLPEATGL
jgi:N-acetyl-gamma-glutamyl-phosphate reductase